MNLRRLFILFSLLSCSALQAQTWRSVGLDSLEVGWYDSGSTSGDVIYAKGDLLYVGTNKGLYKSTKGGYSWEKLRCAESLPDSIVNTIAIGQLNAQVLYVAMGRSAVLRDNPHSSLYKTVDGGVTWKSVLDNTVAEKTNIAETKISTLRPNVILSLHRALGPGAGNLDKIFRSTDGGNSWKDVSSNNFAISDHGVRIQIGNDPSDSVRWYASGDTQLDFPFYASTDGGATWRVKSRIPDGVNQKIFVDIRNNQRIYLLGGLSGVLVSNNGGESWTVVDGLAGWSVLKLAQHPQQPNMFFAATRQGVILKSIDSSQWSTFGTGLPGGKYYDVFVDSVTGYVYAGGERGLFRTDAITDISKDPAMIPSRCQLYQNYPNPFNPVTTIKYAIPERSSVKLIVYDVLGRKLWTLVDGTKEVGAYSVIFNAENIQSGTYFYRLITGKYTEVKRMIVLK